MTVVITAIIHHTYNNIFIIISYLHVYTSLFIFVCIVATNRLAATITNPPQQQQIIGNNVKLTCTTSGLPVYALHWRRGGSRVYPSCKHSISSNSPGSSVLTIYNASEADDGMYECVAHSYYSDPMTATSQALSESSYCDTFFLVIPLSPLSLFVSLLLLSILCLFMLS